MIKLFRHHVRYPAYRCCHGTFRQSGHKYLDVLRLGVLFPWVVVGHFHRHVQVCSQQTLRGGRKGRHKERRFRVRIRGADGEDEVGGRGSSKTLIHDKSGGGLHSTCKVDQRLPVCTGTIRTIHQTRPLNHHENTNPYFEAGSDQDTKVTNGCLSSIVSSAGSRPPSACATNTPFAVNNLLKSFAIHIIMWTHNENTQGSPHPFPGNAQSSGCVTSLDTFGSPLLWSFAPSRSRRFRCYRRSPRTLSGPRDSSSRGKGSSQLQLGTICDTPKVSSVQSVGGVRKISR